MDLLTTRVVIFEDNQTRADLYALWLADCEVSMALTESEVESALDHSVALVVLDRQFGDDAAVDVLSTIRSKVPICRVIGTRDRSDGFPDLSLDQQLIKPVFQEDLQELAERLIFQANYHHALRLYYQTTSNLIYQEVSDARDADEERCTELRSRAERLRELIAGLRGVMNGDDITAVKQAITFDKNFERGESTEPVTSKYRPDRCSRCHTDWGGDNVAQLGANIWRCNSCGHVQMKTDPSHRGIGSYRL